MNAISFLAGLSVATFLASTLFFYKFWRVSRDRFFLFFGAACLLLALDRFVGLFIPGMQESLRSAATEAASWVYLMRLLAFIVIMIGVIDKNRSGKMR